MIARSGPPARVKSNAKVDIVRGYGPTDVVRGYGPTDITVVAEDPAANPHEALVNRMREINELYRDMAYELMEKVAERPANGMPSTTRSSRTA